MEKKNIERLSQLSSAMGVSSNERPVADLLKPYYTDLADELLKDRLGSIFAVKKSKNPNAKTVMIASSLDEVGLMISEVHKDATLSFIPLEGLSAASLLHQRVYVYTRDNEPILGVISANVHAMASADSVKMDQLYIDLGSQEMADKILPGDLVALDGAFEVTGNHIAVGKALNHRLLVEAGLEILEELKDDELDYNLVVGGVAASVVGNRGTMTSTYVVKPDCALVLCGFDVKNSKSKLEKGKGTVVAYQDAGMIPSKRLLYDVTQSIQNFQTSVGTIANDGSFIHKTLKGCPSVSLGVSLSHCGTPNVMADLNDVDGLVSQVATYLRSLNSEKISYFGFGE